MRKNDKRVKSKRWIWITILSIIGVALIFAISLFAICCRGLKLEKEKFEVEAINEKITFFDSNNQEIENDSTTVSIEEINDYTKNAFIAKEDKRFYSHNGYDIVRMFGAMKNNVVNGKVVEGASTISQQLIKNKQLGPERTLERKVQEIYLSRKLEKEFSKDEILEMYLNTIYFGNNRYGIENAAKYYFDKKTSELTLSESAMLSGIITAPSIYNPIANKDIAIEKRNLVLSLMEAQGFIDEESLKNAQNEDLVVSSTNSNSINDLYMRYARKQACEILNVEELPTNVNIKIYTNLDYTLQSEIDKMVKSDKYTETNNNGVMSDIVCLVIENKSGNVVAYNGKSDFDLTTLKRQPASTIKPIVVYAPAIESKSISPATFIFDEAIDINGYSPENSAYGFCGWTTVRDSLARSLNVPPVKILNAMGIENGKKFAEEMGIEFADSDNNLAIALGGMTNGVTFLEIASAYSIFARNGIKIEPGFVEKIYINGERVYINEASEKRVMRDSTAYLITDMLQDVIDYGTARKLSDLDYDIACKTGTAGTTEYNVDAWSVSYTKEHTVLSWVGNTHGESGVMNITTNGSTYPTIVVKNVFKALYKDKKPENFEKPQSIIEINLDTSCFENQTLKIATENTPERYIKSEIFAIENRPVEYSNNFVELVTPEIWVEFEEYPTIKFKSQADVKYEVRREVIKENSSSDSTFKNILKLLKGGTFKVKNDAQADDSVLVTTITGNGRTLSYSDKIEANGRYEYYLSASNSEDTKISNRARVLIS